MSDARIGHLARYSHRIAIDPSHSHFRHADYRDKQAKVPTPTPVTKRANRRHGQTCVCPPCWTAHGG